MRYFIGNWKMFGVPKSINILNKINYFHSKDKNRQKYKVVITPPYTLIETYAKYFKNKRISIGSQNCYQKDQFSSNTAAVSPFMIKSVGAKYTLIGHSDNRSEGDTNEMLKNKVFFALKNNLKVVFCIGENKNCLLYTSDAADEVRKKSPAVLYGGSVDGSNVEMFKEIREIDGFLIGGASKSSKKFIDIIKNYYR